MHCRSDYCTPLSISSCSQYSSIHVLARLTMPSLASLKTNNNPCHFPREQVSQANSRAMLDSPLRAGSPLALSEELDPFDSAPGGGRGGLVVCLSSQLLLLTSHAQILPPSQPLTRIFDYCNAHAMHMHALSAWLCCVMGATSSLPRVFSDRQQSVRLSCVVPNRES